MMEVKDLATASMLGSSEISGVTADPLGDPVQDNLE